MKFKLTLLMFVMLLFPTLGHAQLWSGIISATRAIDWTSAGVTGGIPTTRTQCGSTISAGASVSTINSAISSCGANQYVLLGAGTFNLTDMILIGKSNVTLRGSGSNSTFIVWNRASGSGSNCSGLPADICINNDGNSYQSPENSANWTAGYSKGTTSLTLSNTSNLSTGSILILDQLNDSSDGGFIYICETAGSCSTEGPAGAERSTRAQQQIVTVTGVSGSTVNITPGLYMPSWRSGQSPGAWWGTTYITGDGVENMSLNHTSSTNNEGIVFANATNGWVKGVRSITPNRNHVWVFQSSHITMRDSYFYGTQNSAMESYGIEPFLSSDLLIENNIFQGVVTPVTVNGSSSGTVVDYNYNVNQYYSTQTNYFSAGLRYHSVADDILFEGNVTNGLMSDNIHGTNFLTTYFRNRSTGFDIGRTAGPTVPVDLESYSRIFNMVGNVLGQTGYSNTYQTATPSGRSATAIYTFGYADPSGSGSNDDTATSSTSMRWGNWDVVNGSAQFNSSEVPSGLSSFSNPVPSSHTLPASFIYSSKPSWWGSQPWPPIGPDVSGGNLGRCSGGSYSGMPATASSQCTGGSLVTDAGGTANSNPATDCYLTTMGGSPAGGGPGGFGTLYTFDSSTCFNSSGPTTGTLNVTNGGNGVVTGTGGTTNINCPSTCSETENTGTVVTLTATPNGGYTFSGWSGSGCSGTGTCIITFNTSTQTVTATFAAIPTYLLTVINHGGQGKIISLDGNINCGAICTHTYNSGTVVTLQAYPKSGAYTFVNYTGIGGCGSSITCVITMNSVQTVTGVFNGINTYPIPVWGDLFMPLLKFRGK